MAKKGWLLILLFGLITFGLYFPVLHDGFLTDDYAALYRILIEKRILYREMLRPLIDLSFYFNYIFFGLHAWGYYVFNFCIHALTCFMVYKVAMRLPLFTDERRRSFALLSGLLFAFYPFHNEGVVWLSGRLSSMAALCGMWAIYLSLTKRAPWNFILPALLLIVGLFAYESIFPLPAIILLLREDLWESRRKWIRAAIGWMGVGVVCVLIRYWVAGTVIPSYGMSTFASKDGGGVFVRLLKALGRCVLPPEESAGRMIVLFSVVVAGMALVHWWAWKRDKFDGRFGRSYGRLVAAFALTMIVPVMSGVSTRTSEGDRLLYFPSCLLCLAAAAILMMAEVKWIYWALGGILMTLSVVFIEQNNSRWRFAGRTTASIRDTLRAAPVGHVVLINAPDEWEGAYLFRNNFEPALVIHGISPTKVIVNNYLVRLDYLPVRGRIGITGRGDTLSIYPATRIIGGGDSIEVDNVVTGETHRLPGRDTWLYYWDKAELKRVILP